jgi:hypothetical protein
MRKDNPKEQKRESGGKEEEEGGREEREPDVIKPRLKGLLRLI